MVAATETDLVIAEHGVDPLELGQRLRFSPTENNRFMGAASPSHRAKAGQPRLNLDAIHDHRDTLRIECQHWMRQGVPHYVRLAELNC